uniref:Uncharacterized protein n=1 Tax=Cacopsylla melanoneura TaxID=428564 RepID=A0A8D8YIQ3_9HEMI
MKKNLVFEHKTILLSQTLAFFAPFLFISLLIFASNKMHPLFRSRYLSFYEPRQVLFVQERRRSCLLMALYCVGTASELKEIHRMSHSPLFTDNSLLNNRHSKMEYLPGSTLCPFL